MSISNLVLTCCKSFVLFVDVSFEAKEEEADTNEKVYGSGIDLLGFYNFWSFFITSCSAPRGLEEGGMGVDPTLSDFSLSI